MTPKFPNVTVQLTGNDGNAFAVIGRCLGAVKNRKIKLTWVERGTSNAACLGLDEIVGRAEWEDGMEDGKILAEAALGAERYGEAQGVDLARYEVVAEFVSGDTCESAGCPNLATHGFDGHRYCLKHKMPLLRAATVKACAKMQVELNRPEIRDALAKWDRENS